MNAPARIRLALGLATALILTSALAAAQTPGAPDMSQPPAIGPTIPYTPPRSQTDQLPNGLKIVVIEDHRVPLITVRLAFAAGTSRLSPAQAGLADAEAGLLTAGAPGLTSLQIAQDADALGGAISASAGKDFLTVSADALNTHAQALFQLLADVVLHPTFPDNEVALRKANMEQELVANRADAGFLAGVAFARQLYRDHPYAITAPTQASIAAITRDALVRFHQQYFLPNNQTEIVVAGDIPAARAHNLAQQYFGDWRFGNPPPPPAPPVTPPTRRGIYLINRPGSPQSTIVMGNLGLTRTAPDYFPFLVANQVLGGSFNSRLMSDVREQKGYAYGIESYNQPHLNLGAWLVSTQVRTAVTTPAIEAVFAELDKIRAAPASATELAQAKNYLTGNFVLGLQTQSQVADQFLTTGLYGLPRDRLATWVSDVEAVTDAQAHAAAVAHIHPNHGVIVVVGEAPQLEPALLPLAPDGHLTLLNDQGEVVGAYPAPAGAAAAPAAGH